MLDLLFNINHTVITLLGYPLSLLEIIGTLTGLACVILTALENIWCWPVGIVNLVFFFILFYQVHLYSDMVLQVIFMGFTVYGWWRWTHPRDETEANQRQELRITRLGNVELLLYSIGSMVLVFIWGLLMSRIHVLLPQLFPVAAAFPYGDAFTTVLSVTASILLARKKIESWVFWIIVDIVATVIYFLKGVNLVALEYIVFGIIASSGFFNWQKELHIYSQVSGEKRF